MREPAQKKKKDANAFVFMVGDERYVVIELPSIRLPDSCLTRAEIDVARMAAEGWTNEAIASHRGTSERTIANQMASVLEKLKLGSRVDLAAGLGDSTQTEATQRLGRL